MNTPKISIIIPVYNAEKYISECLDSVINQTFKDIEVICVDDGSTDSSYDILQKYAQKEDRIKVIKQENSGPAKARNIGLKNANSKYIMFCDADDTYEPTICEKMFNTINQEKVDLVICDTNIVKQAGDYDLNQNDLNYIDLKISGKKSINANVLPQINAFLWNKIFKKEILEQYNIEYPIKYEHDDNIFIKKYIIHASSVYGLKEKLYNYKVGNTNSITGKVHKKTNKKHEFDILLAYTDLFNHLNKQNTNRDYKNVYYRSFYHESIYFYKLLKKRNRRKFYKILKTIFHDYPEIISYPELNKLMIAKNYYDFNKKIYNKNSFIENIFSIKNRNKHKVITILGIKIQIKKQLKINVNKRKKTQKPKNKYEVLICPTGFGYSGSGTLLDYFAEFNNSTVFGYMDEDCSGYKKLNRIKFNSEFEFIGKLLDMEEALDNNNFFERSINDFYETTKHLYSLQKWEYDSVIYSDYFATITNKFIKKLISLQRQNIDTPIKIEKYKKLCNIYISKFLNSLESNKYLVCDQIIKNASPNIENKLSYMGNCKQIVVYRDPRDVYVTGILNNETWLPTDNINEFVNWYPGWLQLYLNAPSHPNRLIIRFEDFVLKYDEISKIINDFVGIDEANHIHKREYFNPDVSIKNIGLYKTYEKQDKIKYIEEHLKEYCYYQQQ